MHKKPCEEGCVLVCEMGFSLPQRPQHALELLICCFRQFALQTLEFLLAQRIQTFAIPLRHMKAINDNLNPFAEHLLCGMNKSIIPIRTDSFDRLAKLPRHAGEKAFDCALLAIWEHSKDDDVIIKTPCGNRDEISMTFLSR